MKALNQFNVLKICPNARKNFNQRIDAKLVTLDIGTSLKQILRLLTHVDIFSKTGSDTFRNVLIHGKEQESHKKNV